MYNFVLKDALNPFVAEKNNTNWSVRGYASDQTTTKTYDVFVIAKKR